MTTPEIPQETVTNTVTTGLLGLVGAVLSLLFGGHELTMWKRVGGLLAGVACAIVFGPLVITVWNDCPPQVLSAAGFIMGLGGVFMVRALLATWKALESRLPAVAARVLKARTGIDFGPDTTPVPPPVAAPTKPQDKSVPSSGEPQA